MFAKTADELREILIQNPETSPSVFLMDNSFAAWCYDNRDPVWLKSAFNRDSDREDCRKWKITASEWKNCVEMAALALSAR